MNRMMITATNTMTQLQKQLDIISSNIANSQTTGYKKKNASFSEIMYQQFNNQTDLDAEVGRLTPAGVRQGGGAKISQVQTILTQGSILTTERSLDFAFTNGNQFFKVLVPNGDELNINYTRDGAFYLSPINDTQSALVTSEGYQVLDENDNPIIVTGDIEGISLSGEGQLTFQTDAGNEQFALGIVQVNKPQFLTHVGENLLAFPDNFAEFNLAAEDVLINMEGANRQGINLTQGALEQSNVDLAEEMTNLIQTQRAYQFQARSVTLADQMQGLINGIR